jgi:hypothetical protein
VLIECFLSFFLFWVKSKQLVELHKFQKSATQEDEITPPACSLSTIVGQVKNGLTPTKMMN